MSYYGNKGQRGLKDYETIRAKLYNRDIKEIGTFRFLQAVAVMAQVIVAKQTKILNDQDYIPIAQAYNNKPDKITIRRLRRFMELPQAKQQLNNAIVELLAKHNLDKDKPFELLNKAIKIAEKKEDAKTLLNASDKLLELNDLKPVKTHLNISENYSYKQSNIDYNKAKELNEEVKSDYERELKGKTEENVDIVKEGDNKKLSDCNETS
jgi:hypothetical protein